VLIKPVIFLAAAGLALAGCAPKTGDFGRPLDKDRARTGNDIVGNFLAAGRNEPVSSYKFTDDEIELRDRAWRFLMPETERWAFDRLLADWRIRRILPPETPLEKKATYWMLDGQSRVSPASRYAALGADVEADLLLIAPFREAAGRVKAADRARLGMLLGLTDIEPSEKQDAEGRIGENILLMDWVHRSWLQRRRDYQYALERLVLATPQHQAIPVERLLSQLDAEIAAIDPGDLTLDHGKVIKGGSSAPTRAVVK
jgi:hypothetical protein